MGREVSTSEAGLILGVTPQTVRTLCERGVLDARRDGARRVWRIQEQSVDACASSRVRQGYGRSPDVVREIRQLAEAIDDLRQQDGAAVERLRAVEQERDRYRADAAAVREAALRLNAAALEMEAAVSHLVAMLREQSSALAELLSPASPQDLLP